MKTQISNRSLPRTVNNTTLAHNYANLSSLASTSLRRISSMLVLITIFCLCNFQLFAQAAPESGRALIVPPLVNYSGVLKDPSGKPLSGTVGATFSIYKDSEGGTPVWMETQNLQMDAGGHYSVMLGLTSSHGLPEDLFTFGEPRWLTVQVQGQEEQPRVLLVSVPYAIKAGDAETLGGKPASAYALNTPSVQTGSAAGDNANQTVANSDSPKNSTSRKGPLSLSGGGTTNFIPLWTSSTNLGNSALYQAGSGSAAEVGLATTVPKARLDVPGNGIETLIGDALCGSGFAGIGFSASGFSNCANYALLGDTSGNTYLNTTGSGSFHFRNNNIDKMVVTNAGVGIGTSTPAALMDVTGSSTAGGGIETTTSNLATTSNSFAAFSAHAKASAVVNQLVADGLGTGPMGTPSGYFGTFTNQPIGFVTNNIERMRMTTSGQLGIGTTQPSAALEVNASNNWGLFVDGPVSGAGAGIQLRQTGSGGVQTQ